MDAYTDTRVTKASVNYGPGMVDGDRCGICTHYCAGPGPRKDYGRCELVLGTIYAKAWCRLFEERPDAADQKGPQDQKRDAA